MQALSDEQGQAFGSRILLSILLSLRKQEQDFQTSFRTVNQSLDKVAAAAVLDDKPGVLACQTIIWSFADRSLASRQLEQAAQWCESTYVYKAHFLVTLCTHKAFEPCGKENFSRCRR